MSCPTSAPTRLRPTWVLFGDSITQKASGPGGWASRLEDAYQRKIDVVKRGYSGYNTRWAKIIAPKVLVEQAQLVTVCFGANDAALPDRTSAVQHVPLEEYTRNLKDIISELYRLGVTHVVLLTPPPVSEAGRVQHAKATYGIDLEGSERENEYTKRYVDACLEVGAELRLPVVNLWKACMDTPNWATELLDDGLHLTPAGNELVYACLQRTIDAHVPHLRTDALGLDVPEFRQLIQGGASPVDSLRLYMSSQETSKG